MNKMIVSNLAHRPLRSAISIVAIALEVTLILLIVGFSVGMLNDQRSRQAGMGADVIVLPPGSSNIVGVTSAPAPVKIADILVKLQHVSVVTPVLMQLSTVGSLQTIYGIDLRSYEAMRPFTFLKGRAFEGADDILVDDIYAGTHRAKVGEKVDLFNHSFRIAGIVAHGKGARLFLPLSSTFITIVVGISVTIGFIVIFQAMYTAVMERTREIGILKSLGASKFYIVNVILRETTLLAIGGIILGIAVSFIAGGAIHKRLPTLPIEITQGWLIRATIIAIVGAIGGAIYPAIKAAQKDPIDALAYE